jgi:hypothetical protein
MSDFPGITRAALEMAYDNGGINHYRSERALIDDLQHLLARDAGRYNLGPIDKWLESLSQGDLQTAVAGEESEIVAILHDAPLGTDDLLNVIFDRVI